MINLHIEKAKKELSKLAVSCIKFNDVININTDDGNVIMLSEDNYKNLIESLNVLSAKGVYDDIEKTIKTPTSSFDNKEPWN